MNRQEIAKLEEYLRGKFQLNSIKLHARAQKSDSVEMAIGEEFVGLIHKDEDEGELSYHLTMTILDIDLSE